MSNFIGQSLGRYHILEQLGEGGMATVFRAHDTRLERDVAIKVIRSDAFPPNQLERILKRFEREAKALAKLSHLHIIKVIDYGEHEGSPYLVMEYMPGGTLKKRLGKPMSWQEAVQILIPIAEALGYAHEQRIIHRDIKPSNILLTQNGQPMLTDFGIAKILETEETATLTGTGIGVGTPEYMAPEQWTGQSTLQSDIYSLGIVFYEMVTGRKPYTADTPAAILLNQANNALPRPSKFVNDLPQRVENILLKALAKNPKDRYQNMGEFAVALERLVTEKSSKEGVARNNKRIDHANNRSRSFWITISIIGVAITIVFGAWMMNRVPVEANPSYFTSGDSISLEATQAPLETKMSTKFTLTATQGTTMTSEPTRTYTKTPLPTHSNTPTFTPVNGINLALNKSATGSASCTPNETPDKAVNGTWNKGLSDKWCDMSSSFKWLKVDLGSVYTINGFKIYHANSGADQRIWNTRDFEIQTSTDGTSWKTVVTVNGNTSSITTHSITKLNVRYVRLIVISPEQGSGGAARIYELQIFGQ